MPGAGCASGPRRAGVQRRTVYNPLPRRQLTVRRLFGAQLGDDVVDAGPGELVRKPRGQHHTFWNAGDEPLRFLEIIAPGRFAGYFRELAPLLEAGDHAAVQDVAVRYALEIDSSTIPALAERHGLRIAVPA